MVKIVVLGEKKCMFPIPLFLIFAFFAADVRVPGERDRSSRRCRRDLRGRRESWRVWRNAVWVVWIGCCLPLVLCSPIHWLTRFYNPKIISKKMYYFIKYLVCITLKTSTPNAYSLFETCIISLIPSFKITLPSSIEVVLFFFYVGVAKKFILFLWIVVKVKSWHCSGNLRSK